MANNNDKAIIGTHSKLNLYISDSSYTLVPTDYQIGKSLSINRNDGQISLSPPGPPAKYDQSVTNLAGILGIIRLFKSEYLILIQSARQVTDLFKTPVYTPTKFSVYPISLQPNLTLLENSGERYLLSILKSHLDHALGKIFFTYHSKHHSTNIEPWDLTTSLQIQSSPDRLKDPRAPWEKADDRFFWNKHIQSKLIESASHSYEISQFILPVIFGFLEFKSAVIKGKRFTFGIVSRRSRHRAGTRYFTRGINADGDVSNFNETEMIFTTFPSNAVAANQKDQNFVKASFVQTRGSVPLYWTEINNLRYRPDLKIIDIPETIDAMKTHFDKQIKIYGDQYLVNLVNSSGYEKAVKDSYEKGVKSLNNPRIHYKYFDFHRECKGLRFDRVQILIDQLEKELLDQGYFFQEFSGSSTSSPLKFQKSVVRTNCMDCLDRTNVFQSALAKWVLTLQLKQAGILQEGDSLDSMPDFMFLFRNLWADNADAVSKSYSGTPALKTDFTRLGIRTKKGALADGINSLMRYIKNNFLDGPRQDSYDLFTGAWTTTPSDSSHKDGLGGREQNLLGPYDNHILQAIVLCFVIIFLIFISATFTKKRSFWLSLISFGMLSGITIYIFGHGMEFVNQPRLRTSSTNQTRALVIEYSGPSSRCFESSRHGRTKIDFDLIGQLLDSCGRRLASLKDSAASHHRRRSSLQPGKRLAGISGSSLEESTDKKRID